MYVKINLLVCYMDIEQVKIWLDNYYDNNKINSTQLEKLKELIHNNNDAVNYVVNEIDNRNCHKSHYLLAIMYNHGIGIEENHIRALNFYKIAAAGGHVDAMNYVGYDHDKNKNYDMAAKYYFMAIGEGHADAMNNLAMLYVHGKGVKQDYDKAIELYKMAIDNGNIEALNNLAYLYANGIGTNKNHEIAFDLYIRAIKNNNKAAIKNLSKMLHDDDELFLKVIMKSINF